MKLAIKKTNDPLTEVFAIQDTTPAYANAIRRFAIDYVPTLAVEDIEIIKNNSILYDEVLAHRIGLIPLTTDLKSYTLPEGEVTAMNSVMLTIDTKGPKTVYSKDFQTKDPKIRPAYDEIQVVKLLEGQELELSMTAVMGQGKEHAKWIPANVFHTYEPEIKVNNSSSQLKSCIDKFPPQVVKEGKIEKDAINTPELIDACDGVCEDVVSITYNQKNILITVESFGQLQPKEIVGEAIQQFNNQLETLKKQIENMKN